MIAVASQIENHFSRKIREGERLMNTPRFLIASIAVVIMMAATEYFVHALCLQELYEGTAPLWRSLAEMNQKLWILWAVYLVMAPLFVLIYIKGYEANQPGVIQGVRYGLLLGLLFSVPMAFSSYVVMPIPFSLALGWFLGSLGEFILMGGVVGIIYRPKK
jgi:hypothetical protein